MGGRIHVSVKLSLKGSPPDIKNGKENKIDHTITCSIFSGIFHSLNPKSIY